MRLEITDSMQRNTRIGQWNRLTAYFAHGDVEYVEYNTENGAMDVAAALQVLAGKIRKHVTKDDENG